MDIDTAEFTFFRHVMTSRDRLVGKRLSGKYKQTACRSAVWQLDAQTAGVKGRINGFMRCQSIQRDKRPG
jgi:hypothetical protein